MNKIKKYLSISFQAINLKRILIIYILLIALPIFFFLIDFKYSTKINSEIYTSLLVFITNIASFPLALVLSLIFTTLLIYFYQSNIRNVIFFALAVNLIVLSSQGIVFLQSL